MNRDGYETAWTGPGESITGNQPWPYPCEDVLGCTTCEATGFVYRAGPLDRELHRCPTCDGATVAPYREELTPAGPQLVIPGCETRDRPRTAQLSLWP